MGWQEGMASYMVIHLLQKKCTQKVYFVERDLVTRYGVATVSMIDKIIGLFFSFIGLFCKRDL